MHPMHPLHLSGTGRDVLEFASISFSWTQEACSALALRVWRKDEKGKLDEIGWFAQGLDKFKGPSFEPAVWL